MSGFLMRSPPGIDEGLALNPPTFPLLRQVEFLRAFCATNPEKDYSNAVAQLPGASQGKEILIGF